MFPSRLEFVEYLDSYAARFRLPVHTGVEATGLRQEEGGWLVETSYGEYRAKAVVVATGIASEPKLPEFIGMSSYGGQMSHSSEYRAPDQSPARSILIVGIGNSGAEIASELAEAGRDVTLSVRSGANIIPRSVVGIPTQYFGWLLSALPSALQRRVTRELSRLGDLVRPGSARLPRKRAPDSCQDVPVIGRRILDLIGAGRVKKRPGIAEMNTHGVRFLDGESWTGDAIVLATGYRGAIEWMGRYGDRDECGFGERRRQGAERRGTRGCTLWATTTTDEVAFTISASMPNGWLDLSLKVMPGGSLRTTKGQRPKPCATRWEWFS